MVSLVSSTSKKNPAVSVPADMHKSQPLIGVICNRPCRVCSNILEGRLVCKLHLSHSIVRQSPARQTSHNSVYADLTAQGCGRRKPTQSHSHPLIPFILPPTTTPRTTTRAHRPVTINHQPSTLNHHKNSSPSHL